MKTRQKKVNEYDAELKKHIEKKDFLRINRTFNGREENISGFILDMTNDFLLIQIENEFLLNGYAIIRKDQFDSLRCNKFDRTIKKILKQEGISENDYDIDEKIDLTDWQTIFKNLKKLDYHVIVECENLEEPDFVIGPLKRVAEDRITIQNYDPAGVLDNKPTFISYRDITIVKFGERYSTIFRKYLKVAKR